MPNDDSNDADIVWCGVCRRNVQQNPDGSSIGHGPHNDPGDNEDGDR